MRKPVQCLGMLLAALLLSTSLPAQTSSSKQQPESKPGSDKESKPAAGFKQQIVVTASLEAEPRNQTTATTDVIGREEIEARQATSVADLLRTVPGMDIVQSGGPGQQASLFTRGTRSNHTLVLWNGVELNDPYFGGFNWAFLPTDGVERVEVVRGPFSALYGSAALGGVVQVITGRLQGVDAHLEAGQNGYARATASAGGDAGPVHIEASGHLRRGDGAFANSAYSSDELMTRATWSVTPGFQLGLLARANDASTGIPFAGGLPDENRHIAWQERELALPITAELAGDWHLEGNLSRISYSNSYRDPDAPSGFTASRTDSREWRSRAVASRDLDRGWIAVGAEWSEVRVDDGSVFGPTLHDAGQSTWATFAEWTRDAGPWRLDLGLRRDQNSVFGGQTSPKVGVAWKPGPGDRVHASWAEGFRAPSVGELFYAGSGNPDLQPEESRGWELGYTHRTAGWHLGLTGFHTRLTNLIDFDFAHFTNVNVGRATTRGVEFATGIRQGLLRVDLNATWTEARDDITGDALLRRPKWKGNVIVTVTPEDWTLNLTVQLVGDRPDVDPVSFVRTVNPSYTRADFAVRWNHWARVAPYMRVENLAAASYAEALGFPAPGRTFIAGIRLHD